MTEKRSSLRSLLTPGKTTPVVGAHDGMTARLVEEAGFQGIWASGLAISASYGLPDASLLTMTEFLHAARTINSAVSLPVIADCNSGFGGPMNVARLIQE